jgi:glutamate-1-semialdehyde 2,1-aminomutase
MPKAIGQPKSMFTIPRAETLPLIEHTEGSRALREKSHRLIPGGAHTYAKGDDQYPEPYPGFIVRGKGCHVWDVDGNEFIEYGMGLRSVTLGHGYEPIVEAAYRQMKLGINFNRPSPLELECAEKLVHLIHGAEMVKFATSGSDVTTAAVKLARAYTERDLVAICAEHPFFSVDDWFIGTTEMCAGIPKSVSDLTLKFHYNDLDSVSALFEQHPSRIACVILEPEKTEPPHPHFLRDLQSLCRAHGALLIFDEIITGFRYDLHGAQHLHGVYPDLSTFGKALGNGFGISALVGRKEIMQLGGLHHNRERVFLLSTTFGAETHSLAAAIETMRIYEQEDVIGHLYRQGTKLAVGLLDEVRSLGLQDYFGLAGRPCNLIFWTKDRDKVPSQTFRTLMLQETLRQGILMPSLVVSYSHSDSDIERTVQVVTSALRIYRQALDDGVDKYLVGRPVKPALRKFN